LSGLLEFFKSLTGLGLAASPRRKSPRQYAIAEKHLKNKLDMIPKMAACESA
jgi:hypothetical protein